MAQDQSLFRRLTKLFASGPTIRRRVKNYDGGATATSAVDIFKRARTDIYNSVLSSYGSFDRMARYSDFAEMEATPEIASALDIYAEETVAQDERNVSLHVHSNNRKIQELLETLFYDTLNVSFNLSMWVRNLCKYGDFFLFLDVSDQYGIVNSYPIPIAEIEREEGYDPNNISATRFRWITQGNALMENWQVAHFRLLGNDAFLPYGTSVLDSARRIWRQMILMEDAMLVYRVIRAPERRVFYIDVGNIPPESIADYMNQAKDSLKKQSVVDKSTGRVDLRYNPYSVDEDYFIPVRGGESGTKIDTLAGGTNAAAIEDVQYIQKKLFAALKIPRAYLGYDEEIGAKATLAQEDIRFSRTIQRIQQTVLSELNKIAMIHLYSHGFDGEDLIDFELKLSNPSSIAQQQKLELISSRFEIAAKAPEGIVDRSWVRKHVMNLTDFDIEKIETGRLHDKLEDLNVENVSEEVNTNSKNLFDNNIESDINSNIENNDYNAEDLFSADIPQSLGRAFLSEEDLIDDNESEDSYFNFEADNHRESNKHKPVKVDSRTNVFGGKIKNNRNKTGGPLKSHMPNFSSMVGIGSKTRKQDTFNDPFDKNSIKVSLKDALDYNITKNTSIVDDMNKSLKHTNILQVLMESPVVEENEQEFDIEVNDN